MQVPKPEYREVEDNNRQLIAPYKAKWAMYYGGKVRKYRIHIEPGFKWKPTIPTRFAKWVVPPDEISTAALPHDWMYLYRGRLHPYEGKLEVWRPEVQLWERNMQVTKIYSDKVFWRFMRMTNVAPWRASLAYYMVRSPIGQVVWDEPPSGNEKQ